MVGETTIYLVPYAAIRIPHPSHVPRVCGFGKLRPADLLEKPFKVGRQALSRGTWLISIRKLVCPFSWFSKSVHALYLDNDWFTCQTRMQIGSSDPGFVTMRGSRYPPHGLTYLKLLSGEDCCCVHLKKKQGMESLGSYKAAGGRANLLEGRTIGELTVGLLYCL